MPPDEPISESAFSLAVMVQSRMRATLDIGPRVGPAGIQPANYVVSVLRTPSTLLRTAIPQTRPGILPLNQPHPKSAHTYPTRHEIPQDSVMSYQELTGLTTDLLNFLSPNFYLNLRPPERPYYNLDHRSLLLPVWATLRNRRQQRRRRRSKNKDGTRTLWYSSLKVTMNNLSYLRIQ